MNIVTISSKNQITIPKNLLLSLNLRPAEKLVLDIENGMLVAEPFVGSIVEGTAGSLTSYIVKNKLKKAFSYILAKTKKKTARKLVKNL